MNAHYEDANDDLLSMQSDSEPVKRADKDWQLLRSHLEQKLYGLRTWRQTWCFRCLPRRGSANLLPDRIRERLVDLVDQCHHADIARIGVMALLIDVEPWHLGLERHKLCAPTGEHDVGPRVLQHGVHLARLEIVEHVRVFLDEFLDAQLVVGRGLLDAGSGNDQACFLQGGDNGPGLDAAGEEQSPLARKALLIWRDSLPGKSFFALNDGLGAVKQFGRSTAIDEQLRYLAQ